MSNGSSAGSVFVAFVLVHLFEVVVSGVANELRSMITGRYRVPAATEQTDGRD